MVHFFLLSKCSITHAVSAFTLRPREFESYEISSANPEQDSKHHDGEKVCRCFTCVLGSNKDINIRQKYKFRIPRFRVDDDSSITVVETKTAFEKSLADSCFSEGSFQVAAYEV